LTLTIDKSVSKIAGWIVGALMGMTLITGVCATVTVMTVLRSNDRETAVNNRQQVSENHWRDIEVKQKSQESEIERLKQEQNNDRRR